MARWRGTAALLPLALLAMVSTAEADSGGPPGPRTTFQVASAQSTAKALAQALSRPAGNPLQSFSRDRSRDRADRTIDRINDRIERIADRDDRRQLRLIKSVLKAWTRLIRHYPGAGDDLLACLRDPRKCVWHKPPRSRC